MSEGGIGWVAMLLDRLDNIVDRSGYGRGYDPVGLLPAEVLPRNFWFCTIDDPSTIDTRHRIGIDHIMVEVDYPHGDSTWPDTQEVIERCWGHLPVDDLRKLTHENAADLYRWPLPDDRAYRDRRHPFPPDPEAAPARPDPAPGAGPAGPDALARGLRRPPGRPHHLPASPTAPLLATRGSCLWDELRPDDVLRRSTSTATVLEGALAGPARASRSTSSCTAGAPTWWWPCTATPGSPRSGPTSARIPGCYDQSSALGGGEPVLVDEYDGPVDSPATAAARAVRLDGLGRHRRCWPTTGSS